METICNKDGKWEQYAPYESVDFMTKEDYKAFEKMLEDRNKFQWRSTRDELPLGQIVLAQVAVHPMPNVTLENGFCLAQYFDEEGWTLDEWPEWKNPDVVAWMPLPEPYKVEKE